MTHTPEILGGGGKLSLSAMVHRLLAFLIFAGLASTAAADHLPLDAKIVVVGPAFALPGTQITYNLNLTGLFPHATYAVEDTLPANAQFVSAGSPPWNCIVQGDKVTCGTSQLTDTGAVLTIVVNAPATPQTLVNSATITSLTTYDPYPDNNTDSLQTVLYDSSTCATRQITTLAPANGAALTSGHVTLRWSVMPGVLVYNVWASDGSSVPTLLDATTDTQFTADFADGDVSWYVEAAMNDCPPVDTAPQRFSVGKQAAGTPPSKRRVVAHP